MGGYGSGRRRSHPLVENCVKLDLRDLRQRGLFRVDGATHEVIQRFIRAGSATPVAVMKLSYRTEIGDSWIYLEYQSLLKNDDSVLVDGLFELVPKDQPFGGHRWYIACRDTNKLCQCLYLPRGANHFSSRHGFAQPLKYRSQNLSPQFRVIEAAHRIRKKVLTAGPPEWRKQHRNSSFPPKPPWIRQNTYYRQLERWLAYQELSDRYLAEFVERMQKARIYRMSP
jgi:hypothetical protein